MSLIIGPRIDDSRVAIARERLAAWCNRHNIREDAWRDSISRQPDAYRDVCEMLRYVYLDPKISATERRQAAQVLRRAVDHPRADYIHRDSGTGVIHAAWHPRD